MPTGTTLIRVNDRAASSQQIIGFGGAVTPAAAQLIEGLPATTRDRVLTDLFDSRTGIGLSVLRQPIGPSDFSLGNSTYDDLPTSATGLPVTDPTVRNFTLATDLPAVLPVLREARRLNPALSIIASPWSAPGWMKSTGSVIGGSLLPADYDAFANYLVRFVSGYAAEGVPIRELTLQNEPNFSPPGYAGTLMTPAQAVDLLAHHVAPAFTAAHLPLRVLALDDNFSDAAQAETLLDDPTAGKLFAGAAFHCYAGDVSAVATVARAHPGAELAITECSGGAWSPGFGSNLDYDVGTLLIQGLRDGATSVLKWNVALDPQGGPTNGGCSSCRGILTIDPATGQITRNEEYYALGHLSRFVRPGAVRIGSDSGGPAAMQSVAFRNTDGSHVVLLRNGTSAGQSVAVRTPQGTATVRLDSGAVATLTW